MARTVTNEGRAVYYVINLRGPEDVDDDVRASVTEAYLDSPA
jgi:hypothetical protein